MPAAVVFCALGLVCAMFAIGVNRIVSSRPVGPVIGIGPTGAPGTSAPQAGAAPSRTAATAWGACAASPQTQGDLKGLVVAAPAQVTLANGDSSLMVIVPAGAALDGKPQDLHAQVPGASGDQPVRGILVQDTDLCAQGGSSRPVRVILRSGSQVDGNGTSTDAGVQAQDVHVRALGGDEGG